MPRGDRTGPMGLGTLTGRGAGFCSDAGVPSFADPAFQPGFGRGRGAWRRGFGGRGRRRVEFPGGRGIGGYATPYGQPTPEQEKQALSRQAAGLQSELNSIQKRLAEMGKEAPKD